ncbi:dolichyl-phosphate N-acetylglucosaminephosphotransferase [Seminavis robusta]|uniref:UDP-N-acetylglucosamine--dolichyl-phosphate N-acetylglucosaminephosphotransferase n=1 Tax=Seminavis robusta TaxID=568900 RepID=A0A9N8EZV3_9STRA|nr:dolichyl-phosphate N-acetylglucosaminephosphotransferase [Seminavis robusta]|eukprot:Sro2065_g313210.1 dolichyl-phosphate N-acetylglucosaminephosphotransferase (463) ;mRNA; f:5663-7311
MLTLLKSLSNFQLAILPLLLPCYLLLQMLGNPLLILQGWMTIKSDAESSPPPVGSQLLAYVVVGVLGYVVTNALIPNIQQYTLRKGISGKDLGKRGTPTADRDVPEALGIAPGTIFLVCLISCVVGYSHHHPAKLLDLNSALLSVCFMLFLGFTDDVLDWPWRYKLVLPSVASLPLLCCYAGSTSVVVPIPMRSWLMQQGEYTWLAKVLTFPQNDSAFMAPLIAVDPKADGALLDLGILYYVYMGMLAVFCTNAINIYAGINGLEVGQSFIIGCAVLIHNLIEMEHEGQQLRENHLFSAMIMLSFLGVTLALLRHNWFPATVFVGDTYCYFAGMTFAVVGILGHFSKTLLLFFIPQILNFLWSCPQLFKLAPCPRHRLPRFDPATGLMQPSTFPCKAADFKLLKRQPDDTECANMTLLNLCLQLLGPMSERDLCVTLLAFQILSCAVGFGIRYRVSQLFFDG